jgi:hypothetical protein
MGRVGLHGAAGLLAGLMACSATEPGSGGGGGGGTGGTVPAELVGSWYYGSVSPTNYYSPGSGQWSAGYGEGMFYTFNADGTFEFGYEIQAGSYGCTNTVMWYKSGGVDSDPAAQSVTVRPSVALLNSRDNCHPEWNYEKPIDPSPEQLSWRFGKDAYGYDALLLGFPTGEEIAFYRWTP